MNDKELITSDQKLLQVNPDVSRDEQLNFINAYRNMQAANTDEINAQTRALGTDITPTKGGLTGVGSYLATRYQQPQTEAAVATLRTAAQQAALNQALQNYQANLQEQYNQAYRRYSRAAAKRSGGGSGSGGGTTTPTAGGVDENANDEATVVDTETFVQDGNTITRRISTGEILFINGYTPEEWEKKKNESDVNRGGGW